MKNIKEYIRKRRQLYKISLFFLYLVRPLSLGKFFRAIAGYLRFFRDLSIYFGKEGSEKFRMLNMRPCLTDWTEITPVDRYYFYQDVWAAGKIVDSRPMMHVDIGSTVLLVGILTKITQVCSVDIRPLPVGLENLKCRKGSILDLPFKDGEISSLSSLCVIEHIGLGRYGDKLDPAGSSKAVNEISRVLATGADLYVSVPIGAKQQVYFNAYRVFDLEEVVAMFKGFDVVDTLFILDDKEVTIEDFRVLDSASYANTMVVGCFHLRKRV